MTLDQAISAVTSAEATYLADSKTVDNIKVAVATAQAPLAAAVDTVTSDISVFNDSLDSLIEAAKAQKIPLPSPSPDPVVSLG